MAGFQVGSQTVDIFIGQAAGLPIADRTGHSDPYVVVQVHVSA